MKIIYYLVGFFTALIRVTFSIFLTIFETPMAAHILGKHCAKLGKYPNDLTDEELDEAIIEHHGEEFFEEEDD